MKKWTLLLVTLFIVAGCASDNTAGLRIDGRSQQVLLDDGALGNKVTIDDISTVEKNGSTRGLVTLSSNSKSNLYIQYRFYWYDEDGLEVNNKPSSWRQDVIRGFETRTLSEVSIHPEGTQFRVQIREADD